MSQHDFSIADQGMPAARSDINSALQALASTSKGPSAPTTPYAGQLWLDDDTPSGSVWTLNCYDGTDWIALGQIDTTTNRFQAANHVRTDTTPTFTVAINEAAYVDVASATTCDIGAAASNNVRVTGTTTITSLGTGAAGITRRVRFAGALTLTHNATSLILPGSATITTAADDCAIFTSLGSGNWVCVAYKKANGQAVAAPTGTLVAGTALTLNPLAVNTTTTQAHGLGVEPTFLKCILECVTGEQGYSAGDRLNISPALHDTAAWVVVTDATNLVLIWDTIALNIGIPNKSTRARVNITAANWKMIITPYKLT